MSGSHKPRLLGRKLLEIGRTANWREPMEREAFHAVALKFLDDNNWSAQALDLLRRVPPPQSGAIENDVQEPNRRRSAA